ncbi:MAG: hypothetical protein KDJ75_08975 [Alphaproteobacteria bacterium]|nr:hypothetical protein [Alphaproteobacteria bacterium]
MSRVWGLLVYISLIFLLISFFPLLVVFFGQEVSLAIVALSGFLFLYNSYKYVAEKNLGSIAINFWKRTQRAPAKSEHSPENIQLPEIKSFSILKDSFSYVLYNASFFVKSFSFMLFSMGLIGVVVSGLAIGLTGNAKGESWIILSVLRGLSSLLLYLVCLSYILSWGRHFFLNESVVINPLLIMKKNILFVSKSIALAMIMTGVLCTAFLNPFFLYSVYIKTAAPSFADEIKIMVEDIRLDPVQLSLQNSGYLHSSEEQLKALIAQKNEEISNAQLELRRVEMDRPKSKLSSEKWSYDRRISFLRDSIRRHKSDIVNIERSIVEKQRIEDKKEKRLEDIRNKQKMADNFLLAGFVSVFFVALAIMYFSVGYYFVLPAASKGENLSFQVARVKSKPYRTSFLLSQIELFLVASMLNSILYVIPASGMGALFLKILFIGILNTVVVTVGVVLIAKYYKIIFEPQVSVDEG